jgi:hypothetical protein
MSIWAIGSWADRKAHSELVGASPSVREPGSTGPNQGCDLAGLQSSLGMANSEMEIGHGGLGAFGPYVRVSHTPRQGPTAAVPLSGGVLRIQVNANHSGEAVDALLDALTDLKREM